MGRPRAIEIGLLVGGGLLLLGAFLFIGLSESRGLGIGLGILAVLVARILYARLSREPDRPDNGDEPGNVKRSEKPAQDRMESDRSDSL